MVPDPSKIIRDSMREFRRTIEKRFEALCKLCNLALGPESDYFVVYNNRHFHWCVLKVNIFNELKSKEIKLKEIKSLNKYQRKYSLVAKAKRQEMHNIHALKIHNKQNHCKRNSLKRMHFH